MNNTATQAVHLQGIGLVRAIPAAELVPGTKTVWNYGYTSTVVSVAPKGKQSVSVKVISDKSGQEFVRTFRKTRLVAVTGK